MRNLRKIARIVIEGKSYLVFRDFDLKNGETLSRRFTHRLRRLILTDLKGVDGEWFGAIEFLYEPIYTWKSGEDTLYDFGETLEYAFANLLPHLPLDMKYIKEIYNKSSTYAFVEFTNKPDGFSKDEITYFIELKDSFFKTAQRIVFKDGVTRKAIRKEILQVLANEFEENGTAVKIEILQCSIPVTTKELMFNLRLLKEDEEIEVIPQPSDPEKVVSVKIKSKGIKELEGEAETAVQSPQVVKQIFGTNIEHLTTHGDNSPINISVGDISSAFGDIIKQVEEKEFEGKKEVLESVKKLQGELSGDKDPKKVKGLMENIKGKAAWVYNLIFKNPVLTAYLTQLLLKTL